MESVAGHLAARKSQGERGVLLQYLDNSPTMMDFPSLKHRHLVQQSVYKQVKLVAGSWLIMLIRYLRVLACLPYGHRIPLDYCSHAILHRTSTPLVGHVFQQLAFHPSRTQTPLILSTDERRHLHPLVHQCIHRNTHEVRHPRIYRSTRLEYIGRRNKTKQVCENSINS